MIYMISVLLCG